MAQKSVSIPAASTGRAKWANIFIEFVNALLIVTWLHTGISKLITHTSFVIQLQESPFRNYAVQVSYGAPILEIVLAILLILKRTRNVGMLLSSLLMAFFSFYVIYMMIYVPHLPCSCGGVVSWMNWPQHLAFNISLTVFSFMAWIIMRRKDRSFTSSR